jgi:hypothetical protein
MREVLLDCLFKIIARLRTTEISLISSGNFPKAAEIRKVQEKLSVIRDRLITAQLTEASHDLMHARELLEETNNELQSYLSNRVAADRKLEAILEKIPGLIAFLGTIFI